MLTINKLSLTLKGWIVLVPFAAASLGANSSGNENDSSDDKSPKSYIDNQHGVVQF